MSLITYIGAAAGLAGAVSTRVRAGPLVVSQVASEFASKLAPASVGGMALNVRFLQKSGVDRPVSVSAVGLSTVAGFVGHISLIGVFIIWAGRKAFGSFHLPDLRWFLVGIAAVVVLSALSLALPTTRRLVIDRLLPVLRRAFDDLSDVVRRPSKLLLLFGGSVLLSMANMLALYFSIAAFGGGLPLATVGAVYLVAAAVASAAPTPGGLGALEAALIGGLVAAGLDSAVAVPAVFLFRLATYLAADPARLDLLHVAAAPRLPVTRRHEGHDRIAAWIILGPLAAALVTFIAGRLLGARRGWLSLAALRARRVHRRASSRPAR